MTIIPFGNGRATTPLCLKLSPSARRERRVNSHPEIAQLSQESSENLQTKSLGFYQANKPLWIGIYLLLVLILFFYFLCAAQTGLYYVYPIDDVYIHLSIARNLAEHGIWGTSPSGFVSASSSVAWPLQMAGLISLFGPQDWIPLALNIAYGILVLVILYVIFQDAGLPNRAKGWLLIFITLTNCLPLLVLQGMEHVMQIACTLAFSYCAARVMARENPTMKDSAFLWILAFLMTSCRYEGIFLILAVMIVGIIQRRWREVFVLPVVGAAPILLFGLYSVANGGYWLPNPIIVKSDLGNARTFALFVRLMLEVKLNTFSELTVVLLPTVAALVGVLLDSKGPQKLRKRDRFFVFIVVLTTGMHIFGAKVGWFMRYEAYLVTLGVVSATLAWRYQIKSLTFEKLSENPQSLVNNCCVVLLWLCLTAPFFYRMGASLKNLPRASKNIHDQQIQMGRFLARYYHGQPAVINDLGATTWIGQIEPVDMAGLATKEIAHAISRREYSSDLLTKYAKEKGAGIAIVFNSRNWMPNPRPPEGWIHVGAWSVDRKIIVGERTVHFYALNADAAKKLTKELQQFANKLPNDVAQNGAYTKNLKKKTGG